MSKCILVICLPSLLFAKPISDIVEDNNEAVVLVVTLDKHRNLLGTGSGFVVKSDGVLVTNYHVIQGAAVISVRHSNGGLFQVKDILGLDRQADIAVLKVHGRKLQTTALGDSSRVKVGDPVVAIGHPLAASISQEMEIEATTTEGIISAWRRTHSGHQLLQISAPISPGSSGGLLLNMSGEAIGMTTATVRGGQNINFAIPVNRIKDVLFGAHETTSVKEAATLFYLKGVLATDRRDFAAAEHLFKKALERDQDHADAHMALASIYYERSLYDLQLKHFKEAVRIDPTNLYAHYYLATAYEDTGRFDEAIKEYEMVLRIDPNDKDAHYSLGVLYISQAKIEKARKAYLSLKELNPGLALKLKNLIGAVER